MDRSRVESFVADHMGPMMTFLGLGDWSIATAMERLDGDNAAVCRRAGEYRLATITFDADKFNNFDWLLDAMFHELAHCLLWPLDMYRNITTAGFDEGSVAGKQDRQAFHHAVEMMVSNLDLVWDRHLRDAYLESRTRP